MQPQLTTLSSGRWMSHSVRKNAPTAAAVQPITAGFFSVFSNCKHNLLSLPELQYLHASLCDPNMHMWDSFSERYMSW